MTLPILNLLNAVMGLYMNDINLSHFCDKYVYYSS